MPIMADYRRFRVGQWKLTVLSARWNPDLQERTLALVERQAAAKHPQTLALPVADRSESGFLYLKVFSPSPGIANAKDLLRRSKAARFLRQGLALSHAGFHAPLTIAVGERRRCRYLQRAFVLTAAVNGQSLVSYLRERWDGEKPRLTFREKQKSLRSLAEVIRKFHQLGFVHGDLVPSNIFVSERQDGAPEFYLMDNDRTRRYPRWLPQSSWKRNLVQLNRFPLPGISLQDRMRFFHFYWGRERCSAADCRLLRWLEARTRRRREECDAADPTVNFRRLMRWRETSSKLRVDRQDEAVERRVGDPF